MIDKVRCAICGKEMTIINNRHLARHQLSADQYREQFPGSPMMTEIVAKKLSDRSIKSNGKRKGIPRSEADRQAMRKGHARLPSRKGIAIGPMPEDQKQLLSRLAKERYANGMAHPMQGSSQPQVTRRKIAATLTGRKVGPDAALKAIQTKRNRGDDLAPMRGRTHSTETKQRISEKSSEAHQRKRESNRAPMLQRIADANLTLLNRLDEKLFQLQCNKCRHVFTRTVQCFQPSKYKVAVCDQCFPPATVSIAEDEVADYVATLTSAKIIRSDITIIAPLELDIVVPELGLAIEYCGLYYHSEAAGRTRFYHQYKLKLCREKELRLLTIFEDEWILKRPIVESMIRNACGAISQKINARQCVVRELEAKECSQFLDTNHLRGHGRSSIKFGLFYNGELVSAMTFAYGQITRKSTGWEINRFATKLNYTVRGGASRLFKQFVMRYHPTQVTSYADLRWGTGNVYGSIGFIHDRDTIPSEWYIEGLHRHHRFSQRKTRDDPVDQSAHATRKAQGWNVIYDCGCAKWICVFPR